MIAFDGPLDLKVIREHLARGYEQAPNVRWDNLPQPTYVNQPVD